MRFYYIFDIKRQFKIPGFDIMRMQFVLTLNVSLFILFSLFAWLCDLIWDILGNFTHTHFPTVNDHVLSESHSSFSFLPPFSMKVSPERKYFAPPNKILSFKKMI